MRVAHFDCFSGISGDMTLGALIDAGVDAGAITGGIASLGLPVRLEIEKVRKGGFAATSVRVEAEEEHTHRGLPQIEGILERGKLTSRQRDLALRIFRRLGEAEAAAHGMPLEKVHFHEVGALDSIAGLVYARGRFDGVSEELVDTGVQRLVGDLDELSSPVLGYRLLEAPSRKATLASEALPAERVRKLSPISSLVLTYSKT